ncbi:prokaryotic DNA topoisomerase [Danaus plexippus plexippus]|uniref:DNA topoisomerase n=1 Tax=Danaus plexippus plexippus TaxID=278856 RepID=A0A212EUZ2_DANPL|nr:prokaryotic DNA topoisomerase [Danaus plexippus plexippus]
MKYLNVAEKNDAAKNIAGFLSNFKHRRREGLSKFNKIYEFDAEVMGQRSKMVMTSVSGHLLNYEFVNKNESKKWDAYDPKKLFYEPVRKCCPDNYKNIKETLQREIKGCDGLIIWTDCDREGENIGFEIIEVCKNIQRNINIYRAKFSEITAQSVRRALSNLGVPDEHTSKAVDIRQELDLRIGAVFTRFQTVKIQSSFQNNVSNKIVSFGSCQFPTLGFVVERWRAIENFIPEKFWKLQVNHTLGNESTDFLWDRVKIFDKDICNIFYNMCLENKTATVVNVETKPKTKWRPLPLDTVELEKQASRLLKINAKTTMKIAEKLYTAGIISYPRTETNQFSNDINLVKLIELHKDDPSWGTFAQNVLSQGPNPRRGNKSDQAHPPIHPTKYVTNLVNMERRVYEFIVRTFLACCSKDAVGKETTVRLTVADEGFHASGLIVTERNYLDVYPYDKWTSKHIHDYQVGDTFTATKVEMIESETSPPELLTEANLITLMEKHGIGTDATHADHIETIKIRNYVVIEGNKFKPTELGRGLVEGYDMLSLPMSKPHLRANFEADLKLICDRKKSADAVLRDQIEEYKKLYDKMLLEQNKLIGLWKRRLQNYTWSEPRPGAGSESSSNAAPRNTPSTSSASRTGSGHSVLCHCNRPAATLTCQKSNENRGRKFYKCQECNFFKWVENSLPSNAQNPYETPPSSGGTNGADTNRPTTSRQPRLCSVCRRPGHNITNCPARGV